MSLLVHEPEVDYHTVLFNEDILAADPLYDIYKDVGYIRTTKINLIKCYEPQYTHTTLYDHTSKHWIWPVMIGIWRSTSKTEFC